MRFHLERETEANIARGMSPEAARREARLTFGSVDATKERSRDDRPGASIRQMLRDLRFGVRLLRKSPVFGITAIVIVALGIGAATAIFSVDYGEMLRPLPIPEPERLLSIWLTRHGAHNYPAAADALDLRQLPGVGPTRARAGRAHACRDGELPRCRTFGRARDVGSGAPRGSGVG